MCLPCFTWNWAKHEDPLDAFENALENMPEQFTWIHDGRSWVMRPTVGAFIFSQISFHSEASVNLLPPYITPVFGWYSPVSHIVARPASAFHRQLARRLGLVCLFAFFSKVLIDCIFSVLVKSSGTRRSVNPHCAGRKWYPHASVSAHLPFFSPPVLFSYLTTFIYPHHRHPLSSSFLLLWPGKECWTKFLWIQSPPRLLVASRLRIATCISSTPPPTRLSLPITTTTTSKSAAVTNRRLLLHLLSLPLLLPAISPRPISQQLFPVSRLLQLLPRVSGSLQPLPDRV